MKLIINGKEQNIEHEKKELTVTELLFINKVEMPDMVSVQLNGEFLNRADLPVTILKENDEVEFMYFMGGGIDAEKSEDINLILKTH